MAQPAFSDDDILAELERRRTAQEQPRPSLAAPDSPYADEDIMAELRRRQAAPAAPQVDQGEDVRRALASGALHGFASLPGAVGDMENLWGNTVNLGMRNLLRALGPLDAKNAYTEDQLFRMFPKNEDYANMPTGQQSDQVFQKFTPLGEEYTGQTPAGQAANWVGRFAPAAIGSKGITSAATRVGLSAGGAKAGGEGAKLLGGNEDAEMYGQILGGMGGAYGATRGPLPLARGVEGLDKSIWGGTKRAYNSTLGRLQPAGDPNARFSGAGEMPSIGPEPPPPEPPPAPIDRGLARKGRMTPEKFDEEMRPYNEQGVEPFEFQAYGKRAGVAKVEGLARDESLDVGGIAKEAIDHAMDNLQTRALEGVARMVEGRADAKSATAAVEGLKTKIRETAKQYDSVLHDKAITPELRAKIDPLLDLIDDADLAAITKEARKTARALGYKDGEMNEARTLQFIKAQLWKKAEALSEKPETQIRGGAYKDAFYGLQQALHEGIPGYGAIDAQFSNLAQRAKLADMLVEKITKKIEGTSPGNIGRNTFTMDELRGAFGPDAEGFYGNQKLIAKDAQNYARVDPSVGSVTSPALSEIVGGAIDTAKGGGFGLLKKISDSGMDRIARGHREKLGKQLMTKMDAKRQAEFRKALEEIVAERRRVALAEALAASSATRPPPGQQEMR